MPRGLFDEPVDCNTGNNKPENFTGSLLKPVWLEQDKSQAESLHKLLALDLATNTGWCTRSASGVWDLTPRKSESKGMRLIKLKASLSETCRVESINLIVFEGAVTYGKFPNHVGVELQGVLKLFCEENGIEYKSYMPTEIKKFATGKGNAKKEAMIEAAQTTYGMQGKDDNQADAICLYHLAKKDLGI